MSDSKTPQNDKNRKVRSLGSYALFLFVLVAIFLLIGGQGRFKLPKDLGQDEFEQLLYTGQVQQFKISGTNTIEGELTARPGQLLGRLPEPDRERRHRRAPEHGPAPGPYTLIRDADYRAAVTDGWLSRPPRACSRSDTTTLRPRPAGARSRVRTRPPRTACSCTSTPSRSPCGRRSTPARSASCRSAR
jgi:hypothetical protein